MAISKEYIQDLRERVNIEDVVSSYVNLTRTGKNYKGLCPFHNEKTPSFTVYPDTKSFYCFGCGAGGDVLSFVMRMDNLDYVEAVKQIAESVGMSMPDEGYDDSYAKMRLRLLSANRDAAKFFNTQLMKPENKFALDYYLGRGLTSATITHFGLGYAPNSWHALTDYLKGLGYTEQELVLANLSRRPDGKTNCYDNFRNRMMFPIIDLRGNVVAFSGRKYDEAEERKYVNTSDTPVYKKGNCIFGLNFAKNSSEKTLILVEGQMDVIALHQAGFTNAVACLGTALTSDQAGILSRYANEITICYDNDEAGRKATQRALSVLGSTGLEIKVVNMEGGKDPDEIIKTYGKDRFLSILNGASNRVEYRLMEEMAKFNIYTDDGKLRFLSAAAGILAECSPLEQDIYTTRLVGQYGVNKDAFINQIKAAEGKLKKARKAEKEKANREILTENFADKNNPEKAKNLRAAKAEETLISSLMRNPDFYRKIKDKFSPDDFVTQFNKRIISHLIYLIENSYSTDQSMFVSEFGTTEMDSIARIALASEGLGNTVKECEDCISVIKECKGKDNVNPLEMSDEDYLKYFTTRKK